MNSGSHHFFSFYHWEGSDIGRPVMVGEISVFSHGVSFWVMPLVLGGYSQRMADVDFSIR